MGINGSRRYLFDYADDEGSRLQEKTLGRFAGNTLANIFLTGKGDDVWLHDANYTIFAVWGEGKDQAGNRVWVKQDLGDFYKKCMEYRRQVRGEACNDVS